MKTKTENRVPALYPPEPTTIKKSVLRRAVTRGVKERARTKLQKLTPAEVADLVETRSMKPSRS